MDSAVLTELGLTEFEACRFGEGCWRGDDCFYRHSHNENRRELNRLRATTSTRLDGRLRQPGAGGASGYFEPADANSSVGESEEGQDDEALQAQYAANTCKECGYHPSLGCASSCQSLEGG